MRSLQDTRSAPYTVSAQHLQSWTLALEPASTPERSCSGAAALSRAREQSLQADFLAIDGIAEHSGSRRLFHSILRSEFDRVVGDQLTQDALIAAARAAGVESAPWLRCLVHRHVSEPGGVRQVYLRFSRQCRRLRSSGSRSDWIRKRFAHSARCGRRCGFQQLAASARRARCRLSGANRSHKLIHGGPPTRTVAAWRDAGIPAFLQPAAHALVMALERLRRRSLI